MNYQRFNNKGFLTILLILTSIFILLSIIRNQRHFFKSINRYTIKSRPISAKKSYIIPGKLIQNSIYGYEYTYSLWIYIDDWKYKYNYPKHIFHIGDPSANKTCPGVWLLPRENNIAIKFHNKDEENRYTDGKIGKVESGKQCVFPYKWNWKKMGVDKPIKLTNELIKMGIKNLSEIPETLEITDCETTIDKFSKNGYCPIRVDENGYTNNINDFGSCSKQTMNFSENINNIIDEDTCIIKNIPLKQWFHLAINIHDTVINTYVNGFLYKSFPIENIPKFKKENIYITQNGGFSGAISQFRIFPKTITHEDVHKIYLRGPLNNNHLFKIPNLNLCHLCSKL